MSFYIIKEKDFGASNWCKSIMAGLVKEQRQRRFNLLYTDSVRQIKDEITDEDFLLIIGSSTRWLNTVAKESTPYFHNRVVILGHYHNRTDGMKYSIVANDIATNVNTLYDYLKSCNKMRTALYGVNPDSVTDLKKKQVFLSNIGNENDIFYNKSSLKQCFDDFKLKLKDYDSVICVNDYASISLIRNLDSHNELFITCCSGGLLSNIFTPKITCIKTDYNAFGKAAFDLSRMLLKNKNINSVDVYISGDFSVGETTNNIPYCENIVQSDHETSQHADMFYSDAEVDELMRIEKLFKSYKDDDWLILNRILNNASYSQMADELFLSTNGIKYKLKNMYSICGVTTKDEFVKLLKKYIR